MMPVLNGRAELPRHVESMKGWLDLVEEVVVVDSESTDGTREYLEKELNDPHVRILSHPPGLYQSWNFGMSELRAEYFFVATLGDCTTADSIRQLWASAERLKTDVLVGLPTLVDGSGNPTGREWPLHVMAREMGAREAVLIDGWTWLAWALIHHPATLIGSSASNLYRTKFMQERPFSADYGHIGDSAWALRYAFEARWGLEPRGDSTFWIHEPNAGIERQYARIIGSMKDAALDSITRGEAVGAPDTAVASICGKFRGRADDLVRYYKLAAEYRDLRNQGGVGPWWKAMKIRRERRKIRKGTLEFRAEARELLRNRGATS